MHTKMTSGITIKISDAELKNQLGGMLSRLQDKRPAMQSIGNLVRESIRMNFRAGGRPGRWKQSRRAAAQRGQTLRDSNRLYNSFTIDADSRQAKVGTNVEYAAAHHFGIDRMVNQQVRAHRRRITQAFGKPVKDGSKEVAVRAHARRLHLRLIARPFMMIQDEDWDDIREVLGNHILRGSR